MRLVRPRPCSRRLRRVNTCGRPSISSNALWVHAGLRNALHINFWAPKFIKNLPSKWYPQNGTFGCVDRNLSDRDLGVGGWFAASKNSMSRCGISARRGITLFFKTFCRLLVQNQIEISMHLEKIREGDLPWQGGWGVAQAPKNNFLDSPGNIPSRAPLYINIAFCILIKMLNPLAEF